MDDNDLANLITSLAGLGSGLLIAILSLWWNYKTRGAAHREHLYQQQIEIYTEVAHAMSSTYQAVMDVLALNQGPELTSKTLNKLEKVSHTNDAAVSEVREKVVLLCTGKVVVAFLDFCNAMTHIHQVSTSKELAQKLLTRKEVYNAVREAAGVGPLSHEMLKIFGLPLDPNTVWETK